MQPKGTDTARMEYEAYKSHGHSSDSKKALILNTKKCGYKYSAARFMGMGKPSISLDVYKEVDGVKQDKVTKLTVYPYAGDHAAPAKPRRNNPELNNFAELKEFLEFLCVKKTE